MSSGKWWPFWLGINLLSCKEINFQFSIENIGEALLEWLITIWYLEYKCNNTIVYITGIETSVINDYSWVESPTADFTVRLTVNKKPGIAGNSWRHNYVLVTILDADALGLKHQANGVHSIAFILNVLKIKISFLWKSKVYIS